MAAKIEATEMLRAGLLAGVSIVLARAPAVATAPEQGAGLAATVPAACTQLGARVCECALVATGDLEADDAATREAVAQALAEVGELSLLLVDAASVFAAAGLIAALEASWRITQAVANAAWIERGALGRILYIAPAPDAGAHADAARAGLENLARTLSIEWARYGIAPVTIAPGAGTSAGEIAALTGYLASPAGEYFSGCVLDLRGPRGKATGSTVR
jgi:NAD(P)-dependent dehydrogenase (short-subunit alcohol dehydrogenase family)